jgi:tRNA(Ile)-lysidine synthase
MTAAAAPEPALRRPPAVGRVLQQVTETARRYAMFQPGLTVVVAVSGGPDSVCLLHSLARLRALFRIRPVCFHFDHRLREDSVADGMYVRSQAARLGIPFVLRRASSGPRRGDSVEAWARTVRYGALTAVLEELGGGVAALGQTADDQAETVLLALLRGGGLEAISGMSPASHPIVRPLLEITREETVAFCRSLGLRPRRDPMNEDVSFMRVAVRKRLIPLVEKTLGRNVRATLARTASLLRQDAELLDELAREAFRRIANLEGAGVRLSVSALHRTHPVLAARVVRRSLVELGVVPEASHIDAVVALGSARPGRRVTLPGGLLALRAKEYVRVVRPSPGS